MTKTRLNESKNDSLRLFDNRIENQAKFVTDFVLAETLSVSVWTIRKWHKQHLIPSHKFGRSVRYVVGEVVAALSQKGQNNAK